MFRWKTQKPEAVRTFPLHDFEKRRSDSARLVLRANVDMAENVPRERGEADNAPRVLRDPHLVSGDHRIAGLGAALVTVNAADMRSGLRLHHPGVEMLAMRAHARTSTNAQNRASPLLDCRP